MDSIIKIVAISPPFLFSIMKDWLKLKRYPHFSRPYEKRDIPFILSYIKSSSKVKKHRFFYSYTIQFKKIDSGIIMIILV